MSLTLNTTFDNPNLPQGGDLSAIITADAALEYWLTADADYTTLSGSEVLTFTDRAGGAGVFAADDISERASMLSDAISGFSAARFDADQAVEHDNYTSSDVTLALDAACSFAVLLRLGNNADVDQAVMGRFSSTTSRLVMQVNDQNKFTMLVKNRTVTSPTAIDDGEWHLAVGTFDGGNEVNLWHKNLITSGTATAGSTHTGALRLASLTGTNFQSLDADISDLWIFSRDILSGDQSTFEAIKDYVQLTYGLEL